MLNHRHIARSHCTVWIAFATFLVINVAAAQPSGSHAFPGKSAVDLLQVYNNSAAGPAKRQELLIGVLNKTLPSNETNVKIVRQSLARARSIDDKILLMEILASMYIPQARRQYNFLIENDIKKLIDSADQEMAAAAVIEYSRLSYPADRYEVLQRARVAKVIDDDAYFGELAHGLRFSTPARQLEMLADLERARNSFGNEVLAATFRQPQLFEQLDTSVRVRLLDLLSNREPNFPLALDKFGGFDIARYVYWIDAVAMMESKISRRPYAVVVLARLSAPQVDPRKLLAVFGSPEGERVIRESTDGNQLRTLLSLAKAYADSLPQNVMLNGAAEAFSRKMAGVSPR